MHTYLQRTWALDPCFGGARTLHAQLVLSTYMHANLQGNNIIYLRNFTYAINSADGYPCGFLRKSILGHPPL